MNTSGDPAQIGPEGCRGTMSAEEDARWLRWVTQQFKTIAGEDGEISLQEFKSALHVKESFFAERFFAIFDSDRSGTITLQELQEALALLIHGSPMDKLKFLFQVYDIDVCAWQGASAGTESGAGAGSHAASSPLGTGSGSIDPDELRTVLQSCLRESAISLPDEKLDQLTLALFESADTDGNGAITFEELRDELQRFPGVMENLTIRYAGYGPAPHPCPHRPRPSHVLLAAYAAPHAALRAGASAHRHPGSALALMGPRLAPVPSTSTCSSIAVLMLRRCLTWLRATWLAQVLPLDQNIQFHQLMGYVVVGLSLVHTVAHIVNFALQAQAEASPFQFWELLLTTRPGIGWVHGSASPTGVALLLLLLLMFICSSSCVRRSGHFEVFYWTHLSYLLVWLLLIFHGPNFWKWLLVPGILFFLEKAIGLAVSRMAAVCIMEVNLLPSKVTHLLIKRPPFFHYRPGDYLYLNIPTIARYEWHPFTISSAPEQKDTIWLHIRSQGQWTNRLYESFKVSDPLGCGSKRLSRSVTMRKSQRLSKGSRILLENHQFCNIKCYIDGPYGTPTRRIFASEHAVLIGAGIGITPFASILQSIMYRHQKRKHTCPNCQHSWIKGVQDNMKLQKVSTTSCRQTLSAVLIPYPTDRFLELHMYMTSALGKNDMKAIGLQMALDLLANKEKKDSITGLQTRTQPGRPDWSKVFQKVAAEKKGKVQVFFCGSPALAKVLKGHCEKFSFRFFQENF
uniref:NADPH oxidase 5 n=1 Tax=Macaca nemestrina TaxID=9545 RepID=A0A2K6BYA7_MACNE